MRPWQIIATGLAVVLSFTAALMATARAFDAASERETRFLYLEDALETRPQAIQAYSWERPTQDLARPVTVNDEIVLEKRIGQAWSAFGGAQETGETDFLADWFGGAALERVQRAATTAFEDGSRMAVLRQTLRPEFQHLDGSMIQLRSEALTVRFAQDHYELAHDTVRTTLLRRSTGWHIVAHDRVDSQSAEPPAETIELKEKLVGINYYPSLTPWSEFWPNYDPAVIAADLNLVQEINGNTVRMFLPVQDFEPGPDLVRNLANLEDFLGQAEALNLKVMPTLFDLKGNYAVATWTEDLVQLNAILPVLAKSPAVAVIDIKNEPDLDFTAHGEETVLAWLRTMAAEIRRLAPGIPLTVGWAEAEAAPLLEQQLDVISYHDYAPLDGTAERLARVREAAGNKPVLVTEIGVSAWSLIGNFPSSDADQADHLEQRIDALAGADGVLVWALHDFPDPESRAVGSSFWVRGLQSAFGIYDMNGAARPLASILRAAFTKIANGD